MQSQSNKEACIVELDIVGFTSRYKNQDEQREILRILQKLLDTAGKLILPYGSFSEKFQRHGTGDGYYVILDTIPPIVVLEFVNILSNGIEEHNKNFGPDLPMQFRCVLGFGSVETVGDQLFGSVLSDAERLISDETFKDYQRKSGKNLALFLTNLFHLKLQQGIQEDTEFKHLHGLEWTRCEVKDKHKRIHIGYLSGKYQVPAESDEKREDEDIAYPVKVSILIGGSLEDPLPEAVECAHLLANELSGMDAFFEASFHRANRRNFALALKNSADLLIYIGHGTEDGNLVFEDGMFGADDLKTFCDKGIDTSGLSGALFFACYGSVFSKHLRCPWIAFDKEVLREAPKAYLVQLFRIWREVNSLKEAIDTIWERLHENVVAELKHIFKQSDKKFPDSGLSKGKTKLINLSARMANCSYNDFIEVEIGKIRYPGFDPFIGKTGELASLLQLPSIDSLETIQQIQWVWGTAGMGKSSLLQQFAIYAAETILLPEKEQVILAHISCQAFTSQSEVISKLIDAFSQIFKAEIPSKNLQGLFSFTKQKRELILLFLTTCPIWTLKSWKMRKPWLIEFMRLRESTTAAVR